MSEGTASTNTKGVAIVTGAAQGIGKAIALRLASDGFDVALCDIEPKKASLEIVAQEIAAKGRKSATFITDVSDEAQVKALVEGAVKSLGKLTVMVANAGVAFMTSFIDTSTADFDLTLSVNVKGTMLCYKYAAIQMISQGSGGRIIGASSILGKKGSEGLCAYSASKFAVRGLTQTAALELGRHGITVNAYAPGSIDTEMLERLDEAISEKHSAPKGTGLKQLASMTSVGHLGKPSDVASLVAYLASADAHFITGQSITIDGGYIFD